MTKFQGGYTGKMLRVDLDAQVVHVEETPSPEKWLGSRGWNALIGWNEVPPGTGPFDPENRIIFSAGASGGNRCAHSRTHDGLIHCSPRISGAHVDIIQYRRLLGCRTQICGIRQHRHPGQSLKSMLSS